MAALGGALSVRHRRSPGGAFRRQPRARKRAPALAARLGGILVAPGARRNVTVKLWPLLAPERDAVQAQLPVLATSRPPRPRTARGGGDGARAARCKAHEHVVVIAWAVDWPATGGPLPAAGSVETSSPPILEAGLKVGRGIPRGVR